MNHDVIDAVCIALEDTDEYHINAALDIVQVVMSRTPAEVYESIPSPHPRIELFYVPHHKLWAELELKRFYSFGLRVKNSKVAELFDNPKSALNRANAIAAAFRARKRYRRPERAHRITKSKWAKQYIREHAHTHDRNAWLATAA